MKSLKLPAADRGQLENDEFEGAAIFSNGQYGTKRPAQFGSLYVFNDDRLFPDSYLGMHPHANVEIVTIMIYGEESHKDSLGIHENYTGGDVQLISAGTGLRHAGGNPSSTEDARHLQIWIVPRSFNTPPGVTILVSSNKPSIGKYEKLMVSPDGTSGSLKINQDLWISELRLSRAEFYDSSDRNADHGFMLYVVEGKAALGEQILDRGDTLFFTETTHFEISSLADNTFLVLLETRLDAG